MRERAKIDDQNTLTHTHEQGCAEKFSAQPTSQKFWQRTQVKNYSAPPHFCMYVCILIDLLKNFLKNAKCFYTDSC